MKLNFVSLKIVCSFATALRNTLKRETIKKFRNDFYDKNQLVQF